MKAVVTPSWHQGHMHTATYSVTSDNTVAHTKNLSRNKGDIYHPSSSIEQQGLFCRTVLSDFHYSFVFASIYNEVFISLFLYFLTAINVLSVAIFAI